MKRNLLAVALAMVCGGVPFIAGCEREVAHEREIKVEDDGTVKKHEVTVTEDADGDITKKETRSVDAP